MERVPFGIRRLDSTIGGGAPAGSVVLLSGEPGAGAREFMYTSAVMTGVARTDPDLYDLYHGSSSTETAHLEEVHYVTFNTPREKIEAEMRQTMDPEAVEKGLEAVTFHDLSAEYFRLSPVPREWYAASTTRITDLGLAGDRSTVSEALGDALNEHGSGNLVVIDSLTDLVGALAEFSWSDVSTLLRGLARASYSWGGLVVVHVNEETLTETDLGQLVDAVDGAFEFTWEEGGSALARMMVVRQFRGILAQLEEEQLVRFETDIGDAGFDISDVRKIR